MSSSGEFFSITTQCRNNIEVEFNFWEPIHQLQFFLVDFLSYAGFGVVDSDPNKQWAIDPFSQDVTNLRNSSEILAECGLQVVSNECFRHLGTLCGDNQLLRNWSQNSQRVRQCRTGERHAPDPPKPQCPLQAYR